MIQDADFVAAFNVAVASLEPRLTEWVRQRPTSAAAHLARATFFQALGWKARGSKETDETSREQFKRMEDSFRRATFDLSAAQRLEPNSIVAYRELMGIAMTEVDKVGCRRLLDRALKIQPYSFLLRATYMHSLLPRWGGSHARGIWTQPKCGSWSWRTWKRRNGGFSAKRESTFYYSTWT